MVRHRARVRERPLDSSLEMESSPARRAVASVRVKGGGVLATPHAFPVNVDKFLPASLSHDSLFSKMRAISVHDEEPP